MNRLSLIIVRRRECLPGADVRERRVPQWNDAGNDSARSDVSDEISELVEAGVHGVDDPEFV